MSNGKDGVKQIYPTAQGGSEVYMDSSLTDPRNDAHFDFDSMNSTASVTKKTEGNLIYFNTPGNVVHYASDSPDGRTIRLGLFPGAGKRQKQKFSYANNPGYLYDAQGIASHEFTGYIRGHGDLGSKIHHSLAMKVNGGDDDTIRSLVETNYPTITSGSGVYANWNYTHLAYEKVPNVKQLMSVPVLAENVWVGIKSVHKISADKTQSSFEYYVDLTPFDANGAPNNTWKLAATWEDTGSPTYNHIKCTWKCQADKIRVDGWQNVDFALMSDREVDTSGASPPPPPPPPTCPPGQHLDPVTNTCVPDVTPPPPPPPTSNITTAITFITTSESTIKTSNLDNITYLLGHEVSEMISDPVFPTEAWLTAKGNEIADLCESQADSFGGNGADKFPDGLVVARYYSKSDNKCVPGGTSAINDNSALTNKNNMPTIKNPILVLIFWGDTWNTTDATLKDSVIATVQNKLLGADASFFSALAQYGGGTPSWGGAGVNTTTPVKAGDFGNKTTQTIGPVVQDSVNQGIVIAPDTSVFPISGGATGSNVLYAVLPPPAVHSTTESSADADHESMSINVGAAPVICPPGTHLDPATNTCIPDIIPPPCPPGQHIDPVTHLCVPDVTPPLTTRTQTRQTQTPGDPVPDSFWTILTDTGPIPGPSPVPGVLPIAAVTAVGAEVGNPATNAIDGNLATRWSNLGGGSWIQVDLGQICNISEVDIAWYLGDKRTSNFAIDFSTDSKSFRNVFTGMSTGTTTQLEPHPIANLPAKLIKITVNGNTQNQWASITEIVIKGAPASPNPTPTGVQAVITAPSQTASPGATVILDGSNSKGDITAFMWTQTLGTAVNLLTPSNKTTTFVAPGVTGPLGFALRVTDKSGQTSTANAIVQIATTPPPPCPPGQHFDPTTGTCVPDVTPPGGPVDKFGVNKIYGDGPGSNYFMTNDPGNDPRGNNPEASSSYKPKYISNGDGSFKIKGQLEIRGAITQDNGFNQSKMCTDFKKCTAQGFMQDSMDWKDIEMTSYYRINQAGSGTSNGEAHFEHVMRGQRSTTSNSTFGGPCTCALGCSDNYHGNIYCNKGTNGPARQKYERDLFHTTGYSKDVNGVNNNTAYNFKKGQWFGIKTIVYNLPNGNVQLETWTDENATNTWKKTHSFVDSPGVWPPRGAIGNCNTDGLSPVTFGGPLTVFRSDNMADYDIKWQSIRSIDSTKKNMGHEHDVLPGHSGSLVIEEDEIYQAL